MGLKIITEQTPVTVFANEKQTQNGTFKTYSIGVSSKDKDGNWVNGFLPCNFRTGTEIANKSKINITNSFPTIRKYTDKTGTERTEIGIFVLDYEVVEGSQPSPAPNDNEWMNIPDDLDDSSLPFN